MPIYADQNMCAKMETEKCKSCLKRNKNSFKKSSKKITLMIFNRLNNNYSNLFFSLSLSLSLSRSHTHTHTLTKEKSDDKVS